MACVKSDCHQTWMHDCHHCHAPQWPYTRCTAKPCGADQALWWGCRISQESVVALYEELAKYDWEAASKVHILPARMPPPALYAAATLPRDVLFVYDVSRISSMTRIKLSTSQGEWTKKSSSTAYCVSIYRRPLACLSALQLLRVRRKSAGLIPAVCKSSWICQTGLRSW